MPDVDVEEGVGAVDEGRGDGGGEVVEVCTEGFGEEKGWGGGREVDGVQDEVWASPAAFLDCGCIWWGVGRGVEVEGAY